MAYTLRNAMTAERLGPVRELGPALRSMPLGSVMIYLRNKLKKRSSDRRQSGRWWTRSLNTDKWHFITYSGTCYPLLALAKCGALPPLKTAVEAAK